MFEGLVTQRLLAWFAATLARFPAALFLIGALVPNLLSNVAGGAPDGGGVPPILHKPPQSVAEQGLGVSRRVEDHSGGRMRFRSACAKGTCFGFTRPHRVAIAVH